MDLELLKAAAKAAGLDWYDSYEGELLLYPEGRWDPLRDDGDALRLAVKLNLCVTQWTSASGYAPHVMVGYRVGDQGHNITEDHGSDAYAATRRAIVRAAASMGTTP